MMDPEIREQLSQEGGKLVRDLAQFVIPPITAAERYWSQRHAAWRESENLYRAFRDPDQTDETTKRRSLTLGVQKIVVPYSYATVQSMIAFLMSVLTERSPIIPVQGVGPRDVEPAYLMESVLNYQMGAMQTPGTLIIYQWLLDAFRYGIGIVRNAWVVREWPDLVRQFQPILGPMGEPMGYQDSLEEQDVVIYEGNEAENVSPYNFLPDPRRPFAEFQRGEFCAFRMRKSLTELKQAEAQGLYAGTEFVEQSSNRPSETAYASQGSDLARTMDMADQDDWTDWTTAGDQDKKIVDLHEVYRFVFPKKLKELGLPVQQSGSTPKLWVFTLAGKNRVVRAEPARLPGHRFPVEIIEPNYDVHSPSNFSVVETIKGLAYHMSWLYNARMANVRKTLNNDSVVDPSLINMEDMLDSEGGRMVRLLKTAQGSGLIDKAIFPLPVVDVTAGHHNDAKITQELAETVTGANRLMMGVSNTGRRAATEVQGQLNLSGGRMKMLVELIVSQGLRPWATTMSRNNQAFIAEMVNVRLADRYAGMIGAQSLDITGQMLQGDFLFPFAEAGMPNDRLFESNTLQQMIQMGLQSGIATPQLQAMNWQLIFQRWLWTLGIRDVTNFLQNPQQMQVLPDQQVQQEVQAGNLTASDGLAQYPNTGAPNAGAQNGQIPYSA